MESDQHIGKVVGVIAVMLLLGSAALAEIHSDAPGEPARGAAATALALCCEADQLSGAERQRVLMRGLELAQDAAAADPTNAAARRYLSEALRSRGANDEAHALEMRDIPTAPPEAVCARFARDVALPLDGGLSCRDVLPKRCRKNGGRTE